MKENLILFLTHYASYLDVVIGIDKDERFNSIRDKRQLNVDRNDKITNGEYIEKEADIFLEYLALRGIPFIRDTKLT